MTETPARGRVDDEQRIKVGVDWQHAPAGTQRVSITISGPGGSRVVVQAIIDNRDVSTPDSSPGFVESDGYVSMEAEHYAQAVDAAPIRWQRIANLGRTLSAMTAFPVTAPSQSPGGDSPRLEYRMHLSTSGTVKVHAYLSPTLNYHNTKGLRYAISFDDQPPQIVNMHAGETPQLWEKWVASNINETITEHSIEKPGEHVLKFWMVDPGVVLQKLLVDTGDMRASYLGPPESPILRAPVR
jgi:hypothetical protein